MGRIIKYIFLTSILLCSFTAKAALPSDDRTASIVKPAIAALMQQHQVPGVAVLLFVNGEPYSYYFGYANKESKKLITNHTIFEIGSLSNIMTSLLFAQQIDMANLQPNDSITTYLPELSEYFDPVSLESLATFTSGLKLNAPAQINSEEALWDYLDSAPLTYLPYKQWAYSNMGVGLLGEVLEKITHKDINQLYIKYILQPLQMQSIGTAVPEQLKPYYAQGYDKYGQPVPPASPGLFPAAWGVKMSAEDMQHFLGAAVGLPQTPEKIFYPMRLTQAAFVKLPDRMQGLAWQIFPLKGAHLETLFNSPEMSLGPISVREVYDKPNYENHALIDKTGSTNGFNAYIAVLPDQQSGIVILANRNIDNPAIVRVGRSILFKLVKLS